MTHYFKILKNGQSCHGGSFTYTAGEWTPKIDSLELCESGYHYCTFNDILRWLFPTGCDIWLCEIEGGVYHDDKGVAQSLKLVRKLDWDEWNFRADLAEHVLPLFEAMYPEDDRPRQAIQACRDYATGKITKEQLQIAARAADAAAAADAADAADAAADAAAVAADAAAAAAAARAAAAVAARAADAADAADAAADAAAVAADAADAAADAAAVAAVAARAAAAERQWQLQRLKDMLEVMNDDVVIEWDN